MNIRSRKLTDYSQFYEEEFNMLENVVGKDFVNLNFNKQSRKETER